MQMTPHRLAIRRSLYVDTTGNSYKKERATLVLSQPSRICMRALARVARYILILSSLAPFFCSFFLYVSLFFSFLPESALSLTSRIVVAFEGPLIEGLPIFDFAIISPCAFAVFPDAKFFEDKRAERDLRIHISSAHEWLNNQISDRTLA